MKVFSKWKFIQDMRNIDSKNNIYRAIKNWGNKSHGLTRDEMWDLNYGTCDDWMVNEEDLDTRYDLEGKEI